MQWWEKVRRAKDFLLPASVIIFGGDAPETDDKQSACDAVVVLVQTTYGIDVQIAQGVSNVKHVDHKASPFFLVC